MSELFDRKKSDALFSDTLDILDALNTRDGCFNYCDYVTLHNNLTALYDSFSCVDEQLDHHADGWIPVTERLPKEGDADKWGRLLVHRLGLVMIIDYSNVRPENATHWMPLPQPPQVTK